MVKYLREYQDPHARKAFVREVRVLARKHRGLAPLLCWDTDAERPYYVMPYLAGGPLTRYAGWLDDSHLHMVAAELAHALVALHAALDAHGDVKPDNVLLSQDGKLQVADPLGSGINCTVFLAQNHGGTPGYWAPEVHAGGQISSLGDVYSYGATLYQLLTGRRPQDGEQLNPTSEGYTNAPKIREIIAACCHFKPKARPTMQEVLRMLDGEKWTDIQAARMQVRQLVAAAVIGALLLGKALTK